MLDLDLAIGLLLSALLAAGAVARRSLARSGGIAAVVVGTAIYAAGGAAWFAALVAFFVTSTLLGRVRATRKVEIKRAFEKSDTRDARQVGANGGVAAACAMGFAATGEPALAAAFVGALATANADTWATELGVLSRREPWCLIPPRRVPRGTSGAVSPAGLAASLGGALVIGVVAAAAPAAYALSASSLLAVAVVAGTAGSLADSLLGATLQAGFRCPVCRQRCESRIHVCGREARHVRGLRRFDNDGVNLAATMVGALLAAGLAALIP